MALKFNLTKHIVMPPETLKLAKSSHRRTRTAKSFQNNSVYLNAINAHDAKLKQKCDWLRFIFLIGFATKCRTPGTGLAATSLSGQLLQVSLHVRPDLLGLGALELSQDAHVAIKVQN